MRPSVVVEGARVFLGDCRDVLKSLPDNSVDSIVTDPPYELGFMGKSWDNSGIAYDVTVWEECLRVLKPGGHIVAFGGTRTWHRLAVAVEDAGFEIRDNIAWIYGSGFPKSLDVSKAIDKKKGVAPESPNRGKWNPEHSQGVGSSQYGNDVVNFSWQPLSPEAQQWQGWGTALKPAFEPVVVGRKPIEGTVANNVLEWGVGGLNIDGSRIAGKPRTTHKDGNFTGNSKSDAIFPMPNIETQQPEGRWPANVVLDEFTAGLLDEQSGVSKSSNPNPSVVYGSGDVTQGNQVYGRGLANAIPNVAPYGDSGGASRFFYVAKASKRDRNEGLEDLEKREFSDRKKQNHFATICGKHHTQRDVCKCEHVQMVKNFHPTVKPTQLMRYLIKLVTPEGGVVLDPFTGSGSTGKAALLDGFEFVGAELTEEYLPIIEGRLRWAVENRDQDGTLF